MVFDRLWRNFELVTRPKAERLENLTVVCLCHPDRHLLEADVHSGAGSRDLSGVQWQRECRTLPMLAL